MTACPGTGPGRPPSLAAMGAQVMGRLWTAVLVLAAVFAMHGAQCSAAAHEPAVHASPVHAIPATHGAASAVTAAMAGSAAPDGEQSFHAAAASADHERSAAAASGAGSDPGSWAAHLWTVCLAVLAAGLAVLLAVAARRLALVATAALAGARSRVRDRLLPAHPPDLHVLCVLRT
jgi:hypothetical protein